MMQDYEKIEYVIIDDGPYSVDDNIVMQWATREDIDFKIIHNEVNKGVSEALNIGIHNSEGEIIFNLADDDTFFDC